MSFGNKNGPFASMTTGKFSTSTAKTVSWLDMQVKTRGNDKKRGRRKDVIYPLFEKYAQITDEDFWKKFLMECSYNKFPKGFEYKDGELIHRRKQKLALSSNYEEAAREIIDFFRVLGRIKSPRDIELEQLEIEQCKNTSTVATLQWKNIKSNKMKKILIRRYSQSLHTDNKQQYVLYDRVKNGFTLGYLTSKDVLFYNGEIKSITGLIYDSAVNNFVIDPIRRSRRIKKSRSSNGDEIQLHHSYLSLWVKYNRRPKRAVGTPASS